MIHFYTVRLLQCIFESLQEEITQTSQIQAQVRIQLQPARLHQQ